MKIGIVGGTFNPIHIGHLMLGEYAYNELTLDEVWYMPNGNPPHKEINDINVSADRRAVMTKLAIDGVEHFRFSSFEIEKEHVSYSFSTMEELKKIYPEHTFYFIVGSDSLLDIEKWRCPERLFATCHIIAACRDSQDVAPFHKQIQHLNEKFHSNIELLPMPLFEMSSSDIRDRVRNKKSIKYIVPDSVGAYIIEEKLYI
ncbi:MAG: nicotinate-nucleotide adenylyltransferase [Eubacteriales bacterium]